MRALLQHRLSEKKEGYKIGDSILYQSGPNQEDYVLQEEMLEAVNLGIIVKHIPVFSKSVLNCYFYI